MHTHLKDSFLSSQSCPWDIECLRSSVWNGWFALGQGNRNSTFILLNSIESPKGLKKPRTSGVMPRRTRILLVSVIWQDSARLLRAPVRLPVAQESRGVETELRGSGRSQRPAVELAPSLYPIASLGSWCTCRVLIDLKHFLDWT